MGQPAPIAIGWAPPPLLVEQPPPPPYPGLIWTGGYWSWDGTWLWVHGRWMAPPRPGYRYVQPYYEHRGDMVVFINAHWSSPQVAFIPPSPMVHIPVAQPARGTVRGPLPLGPQGIFVPPPPGSRQGIIIPAPMGTPPAVVTGAPPVVEVGMRVDRHGSNDRNLTIVAPAGVTTTGRPLQTVVPAQAHLAAGLPPLVRAPLPASHGDKPSSAIPPTPRQAPPRSPYVAHPEGGKPEVILPPARRPGIPPVTFGSPGEKEKATTAPWQTPKSIKPEITEGRRPERDSRPAHPAPLPAQQPASPGSDGAKTRDHSTPDVKLAPKGDREIPHQGGEKPKHPPAVDM